MNPITYSYFLKGIGIILVFGGWLLTDNTEHRLYLIAAAYVLTSVAWQLSTRIAENRLRALERWYELAHKLQKRFGVSQ